MLFLSVYSPLSDADEKIGHVVHVIKLMVINALPHYLCYIAYIRSFGLRLKLQRCVRPNWEILLIEVLLTSSVFGSNSWLTLTHSYDASRLDFMRMRAPAGRRGRAA